MYKEAGTSPSRLSDTARIDVVILFVLCSKLAGGFLHCRIFSIELQPVLVSDSIDSAGFMFFFVSQLWKTKRKNRAL